MALQVAAIIELIAIKPTGTDTTLYLSSVGGRVDFGGSIGEQDCADGLAIGSIRRAFGDVERPVIEPGRVDVVIGHDGSYDSLTPGGSNPQWWEGCAVSIYDVDSTGAATLTFSGKIAPRVLRVEAGLISFSADDGGLFANRTIASATFDAGGSFDPAYAEVEAGETIPVALGDFSVDPIPAYRYGGATNPIFRCSTSEIGSVTIKVNGTTKTPLATNYGAGAFTLSAADYSPGDTVLVYCIGRPSLSITDPVDLLEVLLVNFGGVSSGDIGASFGVVRGVYTGVTARRYWTETTPVADAVAEVCRDHGLLLWRSGSTWELSTVLPVAPVIGPTVEPDDRGGVNARLGGQVDTRQGVAHSISARYRYDPSLDIPLGSEIVAPTSGPVYDASTTYPGTAEAVEEWRTLIDGADFVASAKLLGRYQPTLYIDVEAIVDSVDDTLWTVDLADVIKITGGQYDGRYAIVYALDRRPSTGTVVLSCGLLGTATIGMWLDADGTDGAGDLRLSYWQDTDGTIASGVYIGTTWG